MAVRAWSRGPRLTRRAATSCSWSNYGSHARCGLRYMYFGFGVWVCGDARRVRVTLVLRSTLACSLLP